MSDFLTRLAQRQLGQITAIEPRLPGIHTPFAAQAEFLDPGLGIETRSSAATEAETVPISRRTNERATIRVPTRLTDPSIAAVPSRHQPLPGEKGPGVDGPIQIETETGRAEVSRTDMQLPAAISPRDGATLSLEHRSIGSPAATQGLQPAQESAPLLEREYVAAENRALTAQPLSPVPRPLVERKNSEKIVAPQSMHGLVAPAEMTRRANSRQGPTAVQERPAMAAWEPPVQVSIGRIEVTALTAATPAKPMSTARKQGMTLDAYLARRQRGER